MGKQSTSMTTPGQADSAALASQIDAFYLVINAQAVFLMQSGFMLLEVGSVRASHAKAICVKNCCDFLVCTICWLVLGYPLAFGEGEFFGDGWWFGSTEEGFGDFTREAAGTLDANWATWFFQWSFAPCGRMTHGPRTGMPPSTSRPTTTLARVLSISSEVPVPWCSRTPSVPAMVGSVRTERSTRSRPTIWFSVPLVAFCSSPVGSVSTVAPVSVPLAVTPWRVPAFVPSLPSLPQPVV